MRRAMIALAAVSALAALAACGDPASNGKQVASLSTSPANDAATGSTEAATGTTAPTDPNEAALQFAKCMREHGVDMPDPVVSDNGDGKGGAVAIQIGGDGAQPIDQKAMEAANKDCQHFLADASAGFDPPSGAELEKMKEQALAFSKCMRDHGIDMPDPQFGEGGRMTQRIGKESGIDPTSQKFQDAMKACQKDAPGGMMFGAGPSGGSK
jgi:hypothetical protein